MLNRPVILAAYLDEGNFSFLSSLFVVVLSCLVLPSIISVIDLDLDVYHIKSPVPKIPAVTSTIGFMRMISPIGQLGSGISATIA